MTKFWKNTITLEILGTGDACYFSGIEDAIYAGTFGGCSMQWDQGVEVLTEDEFKDAVGDQGTDLEFFGLEE